MTDPYRNPAEKSEQVVDFCCIQWRTPNHRQVLQTFIDGYMIRGYRVVSHSVAVVQDAGYSADDYTFVFANF